MFSQCFRFALSRRLCKTTSGALGCVAIPTQVGDVVSIFYGGRFPSVLRLTGDGTHRLIGDCWIQDPMDPMEDKAFLKTDAKDKMFEI